MTDVNIGRRLKALRTSHRMTQAALAEVLGLENRQSVSQIETGERRLSAEELIKAVTHFGVTLEAVTNPFLLFEKESFSWRQWHVAGADLDRFEARAGEWVGAYRELSRLGDGRLRKLLPRLGLTHESSFEEAAEAGEQVALELELGDAPAFRLAEVMEDKLGILILMVDAIEGVSGAACRLPELNAVLINRHERATRRHSDLAHELFHILTWDEMRPQRVESSADGWDEPRTHKQLRNQRIEQLADNFASGLLMPGAVLDALPAPKGDLTEWLTAAAAELGVSSRNLKWRLANSNRIPAAAKVSNDALAKAAQSFRDEAPPPPFSARFIRTIAGAIEAGHLSSRRAAALLDTTVQELGDLCDVFGVERPVELH